jgi:hypothetical protein
MLPEAALAGVENALRAQKRIHKDHSTTRIPMSLELVPLRRVPAVSSSMADAINIVSAAARLDRPVATGGNSLPLRLECPVATRVE